MKEARADLPALAAGPSLPPWVHSSKTHVPSVPGASMISSFLGQFLIDALVRAPSTGRGQRVVSAGLRFARNIILRVADPPIRYEFEGKILLLPLSHELPFVRKRHPRYAISAGVVASITAEKYANLTAVDVGANVGDTVALWRRYSTFPVLCIEGATEYFSLLAANLQPFADVAIEQAFVGSGSHDPSFRIVKGEGTARLEPTARSDGVRLRSLSAILADHLKFSAPRLLKLDTDGMDAAILLSELAFLGRHHPVIFCEFDPRLAASFGRDPRELRPALASIGYRHAVVYDNTGEFLVSISLDDEAIFEDLYVFSRVGRYLDICFFHGDDEDLFMRLREIELQEARQAMLQP
jgi:FkbM family methyltransferase